MKNILLCITNWGSFADFLSLAIFAAIAIFIYCSDRKKYRESVKLEKDLNRPIIGFKLNKKEDQAKYRIVNYGKGSALNIVAAYKDKINDKIDEEWRDPYLCYSLRENDDLLLKWKEGGHIWIIRYNDVFNNIYFTICQNDTIEIIELIDKSNKNHNMCFNFETFIQHNISDEEKIKRLWILNE
jgi:hypothetical protein